VFAAPPARPRLRDRYAGPACAAAGRRRRGHTDRELADIETLGARCRFRDRRHHDEPGCAVCEGVEADRLRNYHKMLRDARRDTLGVLERHLQLWLWKARVNMKAKRD
jgi:hypothetical protein